jgi:hypothetical protein
MQRTLIVLFLVLPLIATAATSPRHRSVRDSISVDFLLEACSNVGGTALGKIPYFDCDSYIDGVLDAYSLSKQYIPRDKQACFPETLSPAQVLSDAWHLDIHLGPKKAAPILIDMLIKKYPCQ